MPGVIIWDFTVTDNTVCWGECMYAGCVHGVQGERSDVPHSLCSLWYQSGRVLGECSTLKVS